MCAFAGVYIGVSKLLAKFVNDVLKKGTKVNVKDFESTLDNIVFLYGYIQEKVIVHYIHSITVSVCECAHCTTSLCVIYVECADVVVVCCCRVCFQCAGRVRARLPDLPVESTAERPVRVRARREVHDRQTQDRMR